MKNDYNQRIYDANRRIDDLVKSVSELRKTLEFALKLKFDKEELKKQYAETYRNLEEYYDEHPDARTYPERYTGVWDLYRRKKGINDLYNFLYGTDISAGIVDTWAKETEKVEE